jgi:hypothetical protein
MFRAYFYEPTKSRQPPTKQLIIYSSAFQPASHADIVAGSIFMTRTEKQVRVCNEQLFKAREAVKHGNSYIIWIIESDGSLDQFV